MRSSGDVYGVRARSIRQERDVLIRVRAYCVVQIEAFSSRNLGTLLLHTLRRARSLHPNRERPEQGCISADTQIFEATRKNAWRVLNRSKQGQPAADETSTSSCCPTTF